MDEDRINRAADVPYIVFEAAQARMERANKRFCALALLLIFLLFVTNAAWLWYESQFEEIRVEQEVESGDAPAVVSGMGDAVYHGED